MFVHLVGYAALDSCANLVTDDVTAADLMMASMFFAPGPAHETAEAIRAYPRIGDWLDNLTRRPSIEATDLAG